MIMTSKYTEPSSTSPVWLSRSDTYETASSQWAVMPELQINCASLFRRKLPGYIRDFCNLSSQDKALICSRCNGNSRQLNERRFFSASRSDGRLRKRQWREFRIHLFERVKRPAAANRLRHETHSKTISLNRVVEARVSSFVLATSRTAFSMSA